MGHQLDLRRARGGGGPLALLALLAVTALLGRAAGGPHRPGLVAGARLAVAIAVTVAAGIAVGLAHLGDVVDHRQRRQPQPALDLLGRLHRAVHELDEHRETQAGEQPEQQAVGDVLAQRGAERSAGHQRLVDDADVGLAGVLEADGDLGLRLLVHQLVEQVAPRLDLHLEVGEPHGRRILVDRLALEGGELPVQRLLLAQRRLVAGGGGVARLLRQLLDDVVDVLLALLDLRLERHHLGEVGLVGLELGVVVALQVEHLLAQLGDHAAREAVGDVLLGPGDRLVVLGLLLDAHPLRLHEAAVEHLEALEDDVGGRVEGHDVGAAAEGLELGLLVLDLLLERLDLRAQEGGGLAGGGVAVLDPHVDERLGEGVGGLGGELGGGGGVGELHELGAAHRRHREPAAHLLGQRAEHGVVVLGRGAAAAVLARRGGGVERRVLHQVEALDHPLGEPPALQQLVLGGVELHVPVVLQPGVLAAVAQRRQVAALDLDGGRGLERLGGDGVVDGGAGETEQAAHRRQLPVPARDAEVLAEVELRRGLGGALRLLFKGHGGERAQKKDSLTKRTSPCRSSTSGSLPARILL